jgi:hypothetical protein
LAGTGLTLACRLQATTNRSGMQRRIPKRSVGVRLSAPPMHLLAQEVSAPFGSPRRHDCVDRA